VNRFMALLQTSDTEQIIWSACCCNVTSLLLHECKGPIDKAWCGRMCGCTSKSSVCCYQTDAASCLCRGHPLYESVLKSDNPNDVCCIVCSGQKMIAKPFFLSGEKPCCKGSSDWLCFQSRDACPCDADVPPMCVSNGLKCCDCCNPLDNSKFRFDCVPCAKIAPVSKAAQAAAVEVETASIIDEFLLCAGCCCICSMYIPTTYAEAFGLEDTSLCCFCVENGCQACMLPKNKEEEVLLLAQSGQARCIKPPIASGGPCCKGVTRMGFSVTKFAFPCDQEVPCVCAVCGQKVFERTIQGQFKCGDDKQILPATGRKPLFSKIVTRGAMSVKEPKDAPSNEMLTRH